MFKFEEIKEKLKTAFDEKQAELLAELIYKSYENLIKVSDFNELKEIVRELAEAQKRTEERLEAFERATEENFNKVWGAINQLAEAQRRTEERLEAFERITEENFNKVWGAINKLTERVDQLTQRLDQLTQRVDQLAEAQRRTEDALNQLARRVDQLARSQKALSEQVGGLAHTIGYRLEDEAMKSLPNLLARDFGVEVIGKLRRDFIEISPGQYIEVNITGSAKKDGQEYIIIGEAKSQLKKKDVDDFIKKVERIKRYISKELIQILITFQTSPQVKNYAIEKGIKLYFSYEI